MSDNSPYGSRLGVGGRHNQIKTGILDRKKEQALEMLGQTDFFDDKKIVDIDSAVQKIEGGSAGSKEEAPTYNAELQTQRNREAEKTRMMQQYGGNQLNPVGAGVLSAAGALALTDGELVPALAAGVGGFALARHFKNQGEKTSQGCDASQAVEGTQPINGGDIQPAPQLQRDEITSQSEAVYEKKADISGIDPESGGLEFAPSLTDANTNSANAFADPVTLLAQSAKTTTEGDFNPAFNSNMQPQVGGEPGLELPAPGGQPGNVPNPADELVTSFTKGRVPNYVFQALGGSVA